MAAVHHPKPKIRLRGRAANILIEKHEPPKKPEAEPLIDGDHLFCSKILLTLVCTSPDGTQYPPFELRGKPLKTPEGAPEGCPLTLASAGRKLADYAVCCECPNATIYDQPTGSW